jgi:hypothetical protein
MTILGNKLVNTYFDFDALKYINAVQVADGQTLESNAAFAINNFVVGCKTDGIWDAIKASCILSGARTLTGALVPLKGNAPAQFGSFSSTDYSRQNGLKNNNENNGYLGANRNNNADPQNNNHHAVYLTERGETFSGYIGCIGNTSGRNGITVLGNANDLFLASRSNAGGVTLSGQNTTTGLKGISRNNGSSFNSRSGGINNTHSVVSQTITSVEVSVFRSNTQYGKPRISFYSIGEALNLELLDVRVTTLMNTFALI